MNSGFRSLVSMFSLLLLITAMIHCVPERLMTHQHRDGTEHHHPDADHPHGNQNSSSEDRHSDQCQASCLRAITTPPHTVSLHEVIVVNIGFPGFFWQLTESELVCTPSLRAPPGKNSFGLSVLLGTLKAAPNAPPTLAI